MECACVCPSYGGAADFGSTSTPKARIEHKCCECHETIKPGEIYTKERSCWDSFFYTYKTCNDCISIRDIFFCDGWAYESMYEDLQEYIDSTRAEISEKWIRTLTPIARERVCDLIEKHQQRLDKH